MKAWRVDRHGGNEVLNRTEIPDPVAGPMQVRVRVQAVGLNHLDVWVRKGVPGHKFPLPITPGCDIAGTIESFGPGAALALEGMRAGTEVLLNPVLSCGRCAACFSGNEPLCAQFGIFGETCDGGLADFIVAPIANVIARPPNLSAELAACLPIPFVTAWSMLTRKAQLRPGEVILIHAAGSGVSVAAIQIAKLLGATVITTAGSPEKLERAKELGADHVIHYRDQPFRKALIPILKSMGKHGCEVIIDHVGADTLAESVKALAKGGRLVTCGATTGAQVTLDFKAIFFKNLSILGSTMGSKGDLLQIVNFVSSGKLKPVIGATLPMTELSRAMTLLEERKVFGKVVLQA